MINTGITRRVDELGRVVIPITVRNKLHINENDFIEVYTENEFIIFKKCTLDEIGKKVDKIGRVHIPVEIRNNFYIKENDLMEIYIENELIILKKYTKSCVFCENESNIVNFNSKPLCENCLRRIKEIKD